MTKSLTSKALTGARLRSLLDSWERSLRASNRSDATRESYLTGVRFFIEFLEAHDGPQTVGAVTHHHYEAFQADRLQHIKASSVATYFKVIKIFFGWCVDEEEIAVSPMDRTKRPIVPDSDAAPPVLTVDECRRLLAACAGKAFLDRRDAALILVMLDTGLRHNEVTQLTLADVDLGERLITVHRKNRRMGVLPISARTVAFLDRYIRARDLHKHASNPSLWLSHMGAFGYQGVGRMIGRRGEAAGLGHIYPHVLRHTFASAWLEGDGKEVDLMQLADWRSRTMLGRYGRGAAQNRAREAHRRQAPGDQY